MRMKFRILREISWSILIYIIFFIKLTIKMINNVQKNILALFLNKVTELSNMIDVYMTINDYE